MKNKTLLITLLTTSVLSALTVVLKFSFSEIFGDVICFPFEQIGMGLRWLSLQGGLQNVIAIVLYIVLCLSPLLVFLPLRKKKAVRIEDSLMAVLSLLLFYVIYMMINPSLIPLPGALGLGADMAKALLGGTVYSVIVTYLALRIMRFFFHSKTKNLHRYMVILLSLTAILFIISIFGVGLNDVFAQIKGMKAANIGTENGLKTSYFFAAIKFVIDSIPSFISILVIFFGITFINELSADPYSEDTIRTSEKLSRVCKLGLIITVCSNTAFNLLQLIFMRNLRNINSFIQIPLFSVIFVLGVLILSRILLTNKALKDENDSII